MSKKKRILLKLTGEAFLAQKEKPAGIIRDIAQQIKTLNDTHQFGIVVGGGNFFRGAYQGEKLDLTPSVGHHVGMLATMMNGLILQDVMKKEGIKVSLFSAIVCPGLITPARPSAIEKAISEDAVLIFAGGTGLPFFTTDTNAIVRALQIEADEVWKATDVDGVYDSDPHKNSNAQLFTQVDYNEILKRKLKVMDVEAFALAQQHKTVIRIFNIFKRDALLHAAQKEIFGSKIS